MSERDTGARFRAWEGFVLWFLVFMAAGLSYTAFCDEACSKGTAPEARVIAGLMLLPVLFGTGLWLWMRLVHRRGLSELGLRRLTWAAVWTGIGYGLGGRFLAVVAQQATLQVAEMIEGKEPELPKQIGLPETPSTMFWLGVAVAVIILAPFAEELLFRGLAYLGLRERLGVLPAIIITSLFFAVTHVEPLLMPPLFVLAILLARLRESKDDLMPPIIAHAAFNAIGFVALFVSHTA